MDATVVATAWAFLNPFAKKWDTSLRNKTIPDHTPSYDDLLARGSDQEGVDLFLRAYDDGTSSIDDETVIRWCKTASLAGLVHENEPTTWLDDRTFASYPSSPTNPELLPQSSSVRPLTRRYLKPLNHHELHFFLKQKRFGHNTQPDADRRLIYFANPSSYSFLVLATTTPWHQHDLVSDVMKRYLSLHTSIDIKIPAEGLRKFEFQYHLPHVALREGPSRRARRTTQISRDWIDLSFIARALPESKRNDVMGLYPVQMSFGMCGTSEMRYVGYCLEDNDVDEGREMDESDFSEDGMHIDQIAPEENNANEPIWDPREYFLRAFYVKMKRILKEWTTVVRTIQQAFNSPSAKRLSWIRRLHELLRKLVPMLSQTIDAWDGFIQTNGDLNFFTDLVSTRQGPQIQRTLHEIHKAVNELKSLQRVLAGIQDKCQKDESSMEFRMLLANANLVILCIAPISVASQLFAIPDADLSFQRGGWSFGGFILLFTIIVQILRVLTEGMLGGWEWWDWVSSRPNVVWQWFVNREKFTNDSPVQRGLQRAGTHPMMRTAR
ncbi:hypothetical protein T440DRAFT_442305 [Plenodomus tracheiphilus IPT5]|uniref:Cora-domain-containing protein n=1 Tax=Plenodomus tracheiphilus IPT5 TaxID=1408161 RepID=A0A6A7BHY6_9PLEO|nr:hypothetical protein T440DRAFT_442305 [Plenodomus tracheiphilus IPT5]